MWDWTGEGVVDDVGGSLANGPSTVPSRAPCIGSALGPEKIKAVCFAESVPGDGAGNARRTRCHITSSSTSRVTRL